MLSGPHPGGTHLDPPLTPAPIKRLEDLARSYGLDVTSEHVPVRGEIDLNRNGLVVVCGPRMYQEMGEAYAQDPVLRWERAEDGPWTVVDRRTGDEDWE